MSKSLGNVVLPTEICEKWGADLLRLWVASQDYTADVRMSDNVMTQLSEAYRKIRNTFRFALGNLADFDPARDAVPEQPRWKNSIAGCSRARRTWCGSAAGWYEDFEFPPRLSRPARFLRGGLERVLFRRAQGPALHLRAAKLARGARRRPPSIASPASLVRLLSPILVFTAEEIWKYLPRAAGDPESVHLALFPQPAECRRFPDRGARRATGANC